MLTAFVPNRSLLNAFGVGGSTAEGVLCAYVLAIMHRKYRFLLFHLAFF